MPSSALSLLASPKVAGTLVGPVLREMLRRSNTPELSTDESLASLMSRRFGPEFERRFVSALVHGVYAADSRLLSAQAAFPILLEAERLGNGSIVRGMFSRRQKDAVTGHDIGSMPEVLKEASVFSYVDGMESIPRALEAHLRKTENADVELGSHVSAVHPAEDGSVEVSRDYFISLCDTHVLSYQVSFTNRDSIRVSHVVSTLPTPRLDKLLAPQVSVPHLTVNPFSSVTVINIVFPPSQHPIHPAGFGYLVSRPRGGYTDSASGFLGTVFDTCSLAAQDHGSKEFTKLTVMLGGPYPIERMHSESSVVLGHLEQHLGGSKLPEPVLYEAIESKDCIPTPTVGHMRRMEELRKALRSSPWDGRLEVVGASVGGVSLGDCIQAGRDVGKYW